MGEPVGDEFVAGDACANCWGLGRPFGDVPTPAQLYISFANLPPFAANGNKTFVADQAAGVPCTYVIDTVEFLGWVEFDFIITTIFLQWNPGPFDAFNDLQGACATNFADGIATAVVS